MKHRRLVQGEAARLELLLGRPARRDEVDRLALYLELLERWNRTHNLVSGADGPAGWLSSHVLDALGGAAHLATTGGLLVDVGSGGGLPGIPLLCVSPGWRGVLLEPRQKRWAFLKTAIRELELDAEAVAGRIPEWEPPGQPRPLVAVSRAVGGHDQLLEWARPHMSGGGAVVMWAGTGDAERLAGERGWRVVVSPAPAVERGRLIHLERCST